MEKVKVLSLFDGISCGMVALERAGYKVERYYAYEIEPSAITISKKITRRLYNWGTYSIQILRNLQYRK